MAFLLSRLGFEVGRELGHALAGLGLEVRHFGLLRLLADRKGHSQRALGAMLRITPNRMVALIDDLESRGLIERRPHPADRRAYAVTLTGAGSALLDQALQAALDLEVRTCRPLEAEEREQLLGLLRKLAEAKDALNNEALAGIHPGMPASDED
ncbi:MarR family winged helix-turn-helix transcriptional regulator [Actinospica robiniae]|uniref:MarR family winged helix-turn-helix transcriptional regulator n=1 Tax=Actinospica robiniae TaxID=304901 RepID=UPI00146FA913|nr:MarR family transcriptional regulator [Actinospica robiniae]